MLKILLVDSYDSYTFNLHQLILDVDPAAEIIIVRNDQFAAHDLAGILQAFDFVVVGPGPGDPRNPTDVGFIPELFFHDIPILGVCLGFQLICLNGGAQIERMNIVKHGQVSNLLTVQCSIYPENRKVRVTRYHSLYAVVAGASDLHEVGWVEDEKDNGHIAMSVLHKTRPFVGVQYHPESACSEFGIDLIQNFIQFASTWNQKNRPELRADLSADLKNLSVKPRPLSLKLGTLHRSVEWLTLDALPSVAGVAELLHVRDGNDFILLDAAAEPSRYSIIACLHGMEKRLSYKVGQSFWTFGNQRIDQGEYQSVWHFMADVMEKNKIDTGPQEIPFWGGLAGYLSYESGFEPLGVAPLESAVSEDDINMVFVERSIVLDHKQNKCYVQSIKAVIDQVNVSDITWVESMVGSLSTLNGKQSKPSRDRYDTSLVAVDLPEKEVYLENVKRAQQYLAEGQSYELCLTAPTKVTCENRSPWELYQILRSRNPSPFAGYIRLHGMHLLSSSPERFLSWDRNGCCQLRPIKGTVRKQNRVTRSIATEILRDPKEVAENLMIVDLIRHDLHQIATNVQVPQLMQVEEYHTVFQLVSVITGNVTAPYTGLDILSRSLPPGSMTGAPKKRSVELLQKLEGRRRGVYSGVCGYLSVCGGGDWSVIIRSAFKYDSENVDGTKRDVWWIGAGGAITALSQPESEWHEMLTKLESTLPCFGASVPLG
ncbi:protein of unknown function [Taphrina deformans PYCC 5710]|uniref:aminodeoxychorismate synthase n=1 Tax=Taphrina deformans (strain PYCC 5710 / ATCC 11124 / CBS 356.35 / IMI 108563 / JCM 9778 / NBRC 8474) TaxID=1097556 RepID=R4XET0_TAPDE|nr:protein of unknown function [Taphrina deformans PYCC 5710]|eukprot:CCG84291.1 protein of unknown function [Taphrina deformans PYCC 5710]